MKPKRKQVNPGYLFTKSSGFNKGHRFGKLAQPSPCPFSYWATPEAQQNQALFYAIAKVRAEQTRGREKITT